MAINETPCGQCLLYDPILGPNEKKTKRGWCIPRSKYPHAEGPGQVFPDGVERVGPKELAKPYVVKAVFVHSMCTFCRPTQLNLFEEKKKKQAQKTTRGGRRVHA